MFITRTSDIQDMNKFNEEAQQANPAIKFVIKKEDNNELRFTVNEDWGPGDDTVLDNFMASFQDRNPEDLIPKIYDIVNPQVGNKHFHDINYKSYLV